MTSFGPCGDDALCFVMAGGEVAHDPTWHRLQDLEAAVQAFLDYEDTHAPGPFIHDATMGPEPVQVCADEDCMLYWPCPVEQLRRVFDVR